MKELQNGDAKTDEDESAQGSNEQQPFLGFAGTVETDEDTCNIKEKQLQLIAQEERLEPSVLNTQLSQQRATRRSQKHIFFSWLSKAIDAQLYGARLSPVSWADATIYACYLHNRIPCLETGASPYTRLIMKPTDWSNIRTFGASCVWKVPNNKLEKYPGIPRGKHTIFVGFSDLSSGWKLFDPMERKYISGAEHVNFYEDMTQRQDSLRNFDRRRRILTKKEQRPLIINDNDASDVDRLSSESVRILYIDPDEVSTTPAVPILSVDLESFLNDKKLDGLDIDAMTQQTIKNIQQKFSPDKIEDEEELHNKRITELKQKLSQKAKKAAKKKERRTNP